MPDQLFVLLGLFLVVIPFTVFMARKEIRNWWDIATTPGYQPPSFFDMLTGVVPTPSADVHKPSGLGWPESK